MNRVLLVVLGFRKW